MIDDYRWKVADAQVLSAATPTVTDSVDLQVDRDVGECQSFYFLLTHGGEGTLQVELITASDAALTSDVRVLLETTSTGLANPNAQISVPLWDPFRTPLVGGTPDLDPSSRGRYVGLRLTSTPGTTVTVYGTQSAPAIGAMQYPANYPS